MFWKCRIVELILIASDFVVRRRVVTLAVGLVQVRSRTCVVSAARRSASRRISSPTVASTPDSVRSSASRAPARSSAVSTYDVTSTLSIRRRPRHSLPAHGRKSSGTGDEFSPNFTVGTLMQIGPDIL